MLTCSTSGIQLNKFLSYHLFSEKSKGRLRRKIEPLAGLLSWDIENALSLLNTFNSY